MDSRPQGGVAPALGRRGSPLDLSSEDREATEERATVRKHIFIGSLNLDPRSIHENTEIGVVLTAPALAERIGPELDEAVERIAFRLELQSDSHGRQRIVWHEPKGNKTYSTDPDTRFWERFWVGFVGLIPLESQL